MFLFQRPSTFGFPAVSMLVLLGLTACETRSRAVELRDRQRVRRGANWATQWGAAQERDDLWRYRLELCFSARDGAEVAPLLLADVKAACAADTRTLEGATQRDAVADRLGSRWALEELQDNRLALVLACRASASTPHDAEAHFRCAERQLDAKAWPEATVALLAAFEHGSPEQQCAAVQRIDQYSPSAPQDLAGLPLSVVRKCRSSAPSASAPPQGSTPPPEPQRIVAPEPAVVAPIAAGKESGPEAGLQLNGDVGAGTQGLSLGVGVGYSSERFAISGTPGFGYATVGPTQVTTLSLGIAARFYLSERRAGELTGYLRPELVFGFTSATVGSGGLSLTSGFLGLGAAVGGEYLITPRFGVTLELGLRARFLPSENTAASASTFDLNGAFGVMLHQ